MHANATLTPLTRAQMALAHHQLNLSLRTTAAFNYPQVEERKDLIGGKKCLYNVLHCCWKAWDAKQKYNE